LSKASVADGAPASPAGGVETGEVVGEGVVGAGGVAASDGINYFCASMIGCRVISFCAAFGFVLRFLECSNTGNSTYPTMAPPLGRIACN
jgi:hypothetical protein